MKWEIWPISGDQDAAADTARVLNACACKPQREWMTITVPRDSWWEIVDHPEVIMRGLDGWIFSSCNEPDAGDAAAVLTYYRDHAPSIEWAHSQYSHN